MMKNDRKRNNSRKRCIDINLIQGKTSNWFKSDIRLFLWVMFRHKLFCNGIFFRVDGNLREDKTDMKKRRSIYECSNTRSRVYVIVDVFADFKEPTPRPAAHSDIISPFLCRNWVISKYLFSRGKNNPLFYHQIGNTNFFIFITNQ